MSENHIYTSPPTSVPPWAPARSRLASFVKSVSHGNKSLTWKEIPAAETKHVRVQGSPKDVTQSLQITSTSVLWDYPLTCIVKILIDDNLMHSIVEFQGLQGYISGNQSCFGNVKILRHIFCIAI